MITTIKPSASYMKRGSRVLTTVVCQSAIRATFVKIGVGAEVVLI